MALSNYQLILLDNLIYLNKIVKIKDKTEKDEKYTVEKLITDLLGNEELNKEDPNNEEVSSGEADDKEADNGEIDIYWKDELKQDQSNGNPGQCLMNLDEWKAVLTAIKNDKLLMSLKITNVFDSDSSANPNVPSAGTNFRAACFSNDEETVIVFRGTHGAYTWNDNGEGGYQADTASQQEALYYVNLLGANLTTSGKITVTGHSKGGNLAQYVTICAANLVVDRCVSFDGQGFSNEFLEEHNQKIQLNQDKLYSVNSAYDFVNPLLNTIVPESHRMYVESNPVSGLMEYHKPNNVFKMPDGQAVTGLNEITFPGYLAQLVQDFTCFVINCPTDEEHTGQQRNDMIDTLVGILEGDAYYDDAIQSYKEVILKELSLAAIDAIYHPLDPNNDISFLDLYERNVQEDAHWDRIKNATKMLRFYLKEYIDNSVLGKARIVCAVDEVLKDQNKDLCQLIYETVAKVEDIALDEYDITTEEIESEILILQNILSINHQYAQSNRAGEFWDNDTSQKIISAKDKEDGTTEYIWLEAGANASGGDGDDVFIGNFKDNILYGNKGNDTLFSGNGDDKLYGGAGDDDLYGGKGNDYLRGGSGNDYYNIESHDGIDIIDNYWGDDLTIKEYAEDDILYFGVNVNARDIQFSRGKYPDNGADAGDDLYVYYHGFEDDKNYVIVKNFFYKNDDGKYPFIFKFIEIEEQPDVFQYISMEEIFSRIGGVEFHENYSSIGGGSGSGDGGNGGNGSDNGGNGGSGSGNGGNGGSGSGNGGSGSGNGGGNGGSGSGNGGGSGGSGSGNGGNGGSGSGNGNGRGNGRGSGGRDTRNNYRRYVGVAPVDMEKAENVRASTDPIIIDLNQDGIYTQSIHEGAHFDFAGDGYREGTGWIAPQDGMLVHDINGDGIINDGTELFGDRTVLGDGSIADRGFVALKDIDSNKDGKLNHEDELFSELNVWVDHNGNGASEEGELYTLDEIGISEIHLNETCANYMDANGNRIMAVGSVQRTDGTLNHFAEVIFKVDTTATIQVSDAPIDETIKETMPELYPSGMLLTLQQAMTADEVLYQNVKAYMDATTGKQKLDCLEQLILRWVHADSIPAGSRRGNDMDAAHLAVLEAFYGKPFAGRADSSPNYNATILLNEIYDKLLCDIDMELMVQTSLSPYLDMIMVEEKEDGTLLIDFDTGLLAIRNSQYEETMKQELMAAYIRAVNTVPKYKSNVSEWTTKLQSDSYYAPALLMVQDHNWMTAEQMKNQRLGNAGNNVIYGSDDTEVIDTGMGNDVIITGAGDDSITAGEGNDILNGGTGNDRLRGGNGEDIYILNLGDGEDIIYNYDTTSTRIHDKIVFGEGILPEHIKLTRQDRNLIIQYSDNDKVTIDYFFQGKDYVLEHIIFADGTEWTLKDIEKNLRTIYGTNQSDNLKGHITAYGYNDSETFFGGNGNDYIYGYAGDDTLFGEAGDDNLNGGEGNDILRGGTGNDRLRGDTGADTYILNLGDGEDIIMNYDTTSTRLHDKLVFGEGILPEHIKLTRQDRSLIIQYSENDKVMIDNFFYKDYALEHIVFADGTEWSLADITEKLRTIQGSAQADNLKGLVAAYGYNNNETFYAGDGNDYIYGEAGDDILYGETGDDALYGGEGNDILYGGTGNDTLRGDAGADTYILNLGDGEDTIINFDSTPSRVQDKLVFGEGILPENVKLSRKGDHLIIQYSENDKVTVNQFFYNKNFALEHVIFADGTEWFLSDIEKRLRIIQGSAQADNLKGLVAAYGYNNNETFYAGDGNDYIYGEAGDDILYGETGDDALYAGDGNDILYGGTGNDTLRGDAGVDTYILNLGDGEDSIINFDATPSRVQDKLVFGEGILPENIKLSRKGDHLIIQYSENDTVKIDSFFSNKNYALEHIIFADGTQWTLSDITERLRTIQGSTQEDKLKGHSTAYGYNDSETFFGGEGNDIIYGETGDDTLYGEASNDNLNGGEGNDILNGGTGNDTLRGDAGADTYILNLGDGEDSIINFDSTPSRVQDKLIFGEGILPENIKLSRNGNHLIIQYSENDTVKIDSFFSNKNYALEHIVFADGTEWALSDITEKIRIIEKSVQSSDTLKGKTAAYGYNDSEIFFGSDETDYIYGESGDDILYGKDGNDTLRGGEGDDILNGDNGNDNLRGDNGDDIYFFSYGCGYDTITNADNNETSIDTILFGNDVSPDDISVAKNNYDLILFIGQHDAIRVSNYYKDAGSRIDQIAFADGTLYHADAIEALVSQCEKEAVSITNANTSAVDTDVMNRMNLLIQTMNSMQDDGTMITGQPEQTGSNIPDNLLCFFKSN